MASAINEQVLNTFLAAHARLATAMPARKGGRVVECAGLEIRYTVIPYRGFKSHPFRH